MSGSRVFLDLTDFFPSGVRQHSCMYLDYERNKTVKDVQDYISRLFGIDSPFHILHDGWLMPPSESSLLFRDNDTVCIVPEEDLKLSQASVESKVSVDTVCQKKTSAPSCQKVVQKVAECNALLTNGSAQVHVEENEETHKTNSLLLNGSVERNSQENVTLCVKNPFARPSAVVDSSSLDSNRESKPNNLLQPNTKLPLPPSQEQDFVSESECGGRKRKRVRRKKKKAHAEGELESTEKKQSPYIMNKYLQGVSHILKTSVPAVVATPAVPAIVAMPAVPASAPNKRKHFFFNDEDDNSHEKNMKPSVNSSLSQEACALQKSVPAVTSVGALSKLLSLGDQSMKSPMVFERKKSEISGAAESNLVPSKPTSQSSFKLIPLGAMPEKEAVIQFQILKMVNYSPTVSEKITARVISLDNTSHQLYVQIIDGHNELQIEKGKFSLENDDEEEEEKPPAEFIYLNWHDLIEAKAVEYY